MCTFEAGPKPSSFWQDTIKAKKIKRKKKFFIFKKFMLLFFNCRHLRHNRDIRSSQNWNFVFPLHFSYLPAMPILLSRPFRVSNLSKQPAPWQCTTCVQSPGGGVHCGFGKKRIMWQGLLATNVNGLLRQKQTDTSFFYRVTEIFQIRDTFRRAVLAQISRSSSGLLILSQPFLGFVYFKINFQKMPCLF